MIGDPNLSNKLLKCWDAAEAKGSDLSTKTIETRAENAVRTSDTPPPASRKRVRIEHKISSNSLFLVIGRTVFTEDSIKVYLVFEVSELHRVVIPIRK